MIHIACLLDHFLNSLLVTEAPLIKETVGLTHFAIDSVQHANR